MGEFSHMLKPKRIDFKYGAGFPLKEVQVDVDKVSAIYSITEAFAFSILSGDAKVLDETVRNELNVLGVEKFEQLYRVWSEFSLIVSAIREAENLAQAVKELFNAENEIKVIGIRHGEKMYETLLTNEECERAEDLGDYFRVPADQRDLNYDKYFKEGSTKRNTLSEFNSNNTRILNVEEVKEKLLSLSYIREEIENWNNR